ncbi:MAG TPA: pseudouridine synthase, partial [Ignavibacteriaceae bacterium]|nr:pseudouridine synthase [Ignavibacteriaceae bacterium]
PYGVLTQFTDKKKRKTLADVYNFPKEIYPVGRLDMDSEGLLRLTNDKFLTDYLLNPVNKNEKEYYVLVEGIPTEADLQELKRGVNIQGKKTLMAKAKLIDEPGFSGRVPPVNCKKKTSCNWLSIVITEGRFRQVRKMTAAIGHPTLRLVRIRIKNLLLGEMKPGEARELTRKEIEDLKK